MEMTRTCEAEAILARTRREMRIERLRLLVWTAVVVIGVAFWAAVIWACFTYLP